MNALLQQESDCCPTCGAIGTERWTYKDIPVCEECWLDVAQDNQQRPWRRSEAGSPRVRWWQRYLYSGIVPRICESRLSPGEAKQKGVFSSKRRRFNK
jgi:hypothetical protein